MVVFDPVQHLCLNRGHKGYVLKSMFVVFLSIHTAMCKHVYTIFLMNGCLHASCEYKHMTYKHKRVFMCSVCVSVLICQYSDAVQLKWFMLFHLCSRHLPV